MKQRILLLFFVGYALTVLQASLQALVPFRILVPELGLLVVLYAGLGASDSISRACALALALGYVTDLLAGAPKGLHALAFVLLCLVAKGAQVRLLLRGPGPIMGFAFFASLLDAALLVGARSQLETGGHAMLWIAPAQAVVTALLAPVIFAFLRRIEGRLGRAAAL